MKKFVMDLDPDPDRILSLLINNHANSGSVKLVVSDW